MAVFHFFPINLNYLGSKESSRCHTLHYPNPLTADTHDHHDRRSRPRQSLRLCPCPRPRHWVCWLHQGELPWPSVLHHHSAAPGAAWWWRRGPWLACGCPWGGQERPEWDWEPPWAAGSLSRTCGGRWGMFKASYRRIYFIYLKLRDYRSLFLRWLTSPPHSEWLIFLFRELWETRGGKRTAAVSVGPVSDPVTWGTEHF